MASEETLGKKEFEERGGGLLSIATKEPPKRIAPTGRPWLSQVRTVVHSRAIDFQWYRNGVSDMLPAKMDSEFGTAKGI